MGKAKSEERKCLWCGKPLPEWERWWCNLYHRYRYGIKIKKWGM